jgi:hypothetical protein
MRKPGSDQDQRIDRAWVRSPVIRDFPVTVAVDGAIGYRVRALPSGKSLGEFTDSIAAMRHALRLVAGGRSPKTLSLDWVKASGETGKIAAGPWLERFARWALFGERHRLG